MGRGEVHDKRTSFSMNTQAAEVSPIIRNSVSPAADFQHGPSSMLLLKLVGQRLQQTNSQITSLVFLIARNEQVGFIDFPGIRGIVKLIRHVVFSLGDLARLTRRERWCDFFCVCPFFFFTPFFFRQLETGCSYTAREGSSPFWERRLQCQEAERAGASVATKEQASRQQRFPKRSCWRPKNVVSRPSRRDQIHSCWCDFFRMPSVSTF